MNHRVPTPVEMNSIDTVYNVFGKSEQMAAEKYARLPDSVLYDRRLSPAARCVYGVLARHTYQGTTVRIGQRRIAKLLRMHLETVNAAIHELERYSHIVINGAGKTRRIYHLTSSVFGQKQRAGLEEVIGSPSGVPRLASTRIA